MLPAVVIKDGNQTTFKAFSEQNEQKIANDGQPEVITTSRSVEMYQSTIPSADVIPERYGNDSTNKFLNSFLLTKVIPLSNDSLNYDSLWRHHNAYSKLTTGQQQINSSTAAPFSKVSYYRINSKAMASIKLFNEMFRLTKRRKYVNVQRIVNKNKDLDIVASRIRAIAHEFCDGRDIAKFMPLLKADGSFSDIKYVNDLQAIRIHGRRIGAIAVRELEDNGSLSTITVASFAYLTYHVPSISSTNWWWHVIGVPSSIWQAIFIAHQHLSPVIVDHFMNRYFKDTYSGSVWDPSLNAEMMAGGNFAPRAVMALVEGYVRGSFEKYYLEVKSIFHKEVVDKEPWEGNGFRHDGCLHQHNLRFQRKTKDGISQQILSHIYNNNYGKEFLKNAALLIWLVDGTAFDFGNRIEEAVFASFFDCEVWLYRYTTVEPTSTGRFIDSGKIVTKIGGLDAVERTLKIFEKIGRKQEAVQSALHRYYNALPEKKFALEGNRYFFSSDLLAHQRRKYMATLRLLSSRSSRPESKPNWPKGENSKGYYQGDGFLTILVTGEEYGSFNREVFQVYDWARVPGTTCLYTKAVPQVPTAPYFVKHAYNDADFVGGVSNGKLGVASMIYARPTVALRSKKSWFFFDDLVVCLGSDIFLPQEFVTGNQVSTILTQVEYNGSYIIGNPFWRKTFGVDRDNSSFWWDTYSTSEVTWIYHNFIGYVPLNEYGLINIHVAKKYINKDPITLFSSWLDHSSSPVNSKYSYAILPSWSPSDVADFAWRPKVAILNQTSDQHAVCYSSNVLGVVLFESGCLSLNACFSSFIENVCLDQPGMILVTIIDYKNGFDNLCPNGVLPAFSVANKGQENIAQRRYLESFKKKRIHEFRSAIYDGNEPNPNSSSNSQSQVDLNIKNLNSDSSSKMEYQRNDVIYEYVKNPIPKTLMKVSLADPTQKLKYLNMKVRSKLLQNDFIVELPKAPRLGDSTHLCILEP